MCGYSPWSSGEDWGSASLGLEPSVKHLTGSASCGPEALDSSAASRHLRAFLIGAGCPHSPGQNVRTHSLKTTLRSWTTQWSTKALSTRMIAKHSERRDHLILTYSRDISIAALKGLSAMFGPIKRWHVDRNASRSETVAAATDQELAELNENLQEDEAVVQQSNQQNQ